MKQQPQYYFVPDEQHTLPTAPPGYKLVPAAPPVAKKKAKGKGQKAKAKPAGSSGGNEVAWIWVIAAALVLIGIGVLGKGF